MNLGDISLWHSLFRPLKIIITFNGKCTINWTVQTEKKEGGKKEI